MVILENAVFPPRESQKSLDRKVGDRKGGSRSNEMQTKPQGLARLFSDLAKAAVMKKSMSPISNGLGKSSGDKPPWPEAGHLWTLDPPIQARCLASQESPALMQPWACSAESVPKPDALELAPQSPTQQICTRLSPRQDWPQPSTQAPQHRHSNRHAEEQRWPLQPRVGRSQPSQAPPCFTTPGHLGAQHGLRRACPQPQPVRTMLATGHSLRACPAPLTPGPPTQAPHLLGLSLRLVLRARKLSFSGVSSKDRRTLERRPWQSGADLSRRPEGTGPSRHPQASSLHTCQPRCTVSLG